MYGSGVGFVGFFAVFCYRGNKNNKKRLVKNAGIYFFRCLLFLNAKNLWILL